MARTCKWGSPARPYELRLRAFRMVALLLDAHPRGLEIRELMESIGISRARLYRMRASAHEAGLTIVSSDPQPRAHPTNAVV